MSSAIATEIGRALLDGIASVRARVGDPTAEVAVITPSTVNGALARRELGLAGAFIRVSFVTVGGLVASLAAPILRERKLVREPAGWMRTTLARRVHAGALPGGYESVLAEPGWMTALVASLAMLESGDLDANALRAVASAGSVHGDVAARGQMLAALLDAVADARTLEGLAGPREEASAALEAARAHPARGARGAVLLGDARGSRLTSDVLSHWLSSRPVLRIDLPALAQLTPAQHGLLASAPHAQTTRVELASPNVSVVRTPDPVRETGEAVREAQRAVARGVALDRIAIVLPDPSEVVSLEEALERASLPATFLIGPSLAGTSAARFLLHALELALGEGDVRAWYELLRQPAMRLGSHLGEDVVAQRGRFRRIFSRSGASRRTERIVSAIERWAASLDEGDTQETRDRIATSRAAAAALTLAIRSVHAELVALGVARPLGAHARAFAAFVTKWWIPSADARAVGSLLADVGRSISGSPIGLAEAVVTIREMLEATEHLRGSLRDPAVRVLSPMQLTGGVFDVVLVTGVTEGRFPAKPSEDPVVPDELVDALNAAHAAGLFRSTDRVPLERRRLAAIRSAARGELWLSSPRVDMLQGRPLLPGSLLLELMSETMGERVGYRQLEACAPLCGRRSRPWPDVPSDALGSLEHLLARLHSTDEATRRAALEALADHTTSRRLMLRARSLERVASGEVSTALAPYADRVDPVVMVCLGLRGDVPLTPSAFAQLMSEPRKFLLRRMLGAWPAPRFPMLSWTPSAHWVWQARLVDVSDDVLSNRAWTPPQLRTALHESLEQESARAGLEAQAELKRTDRLAGRATEAMAQARPTTGPLATLESSPLDDSMPWRIAEGRARREGSSLAWILKTVPGPDSVGNATVELIEAAAQRARGPVDALAFVDVTGTRRDAPGAATFIADVLEAARITTRAARLGLYAATAPDSVFLDEWAEVLDVGRSK